MPYRSTRILSSTPTPFNSSFRNPASLRNAVPRVQARLQSGVNKDWEGSSKEKHTTHRVKEEKDYTDPQTIGASRTMQDREENYGVGNTGMSNAATERGGLKNEKATKKEHPKAPEPIIGMNDERAQVSCCCCQYLDKTMLTTLIERSIFVLMALGVTLAKTE